MRNEEYRLNIKSLVKLIFQRYLSASNPLVDALAQHIPSPEESTRRIIELNYAGDKTGDFY